MVSNRRKKHWRMDGSHTHPRQHHNPPRSSITSVAAVGHGAVDDPQVGLRDGLPERRDKAGRPHERRDWLT